MGMSLFGRQIEQLVGVVDAGLVPVRNGSEARWARDASGRTWVRKRESNTGVEGLLAEAVSYLLGKLLEVRQPMGAVFYDGTEWSWMSERVPAAGEHWDSDMRDYISNLDEVARMLVLDALTLNEDRHGQNILVQPVEDETHLRLWAIDSGNAHIGNPGDYIARQLDAPDPRNHARGLPIAAIAGSALTAAAAVSHLDVQLLRACVGEGVALAREPAEVGVALASALIARCTVAPTIVGNYLDRLGALQ